MSIVDIEGIVGVGKSTLCSKFKKLYPKKFVNIPEFSNPKFLSMYLLNPGKYAFSFQMTVLTDRFNTQRYANQLKKEGYVVLIDRGLVGDLSFALMQKNLGYFTDDEWDVYFNTFSNFLINDLHCPDLIIHLKCSTNSSIERLKLRGNENEISNYDEKYLKELDKAHDKAFEIYNDLRNQNINKITIDWDVMDINKIEKIFFI